MMFFAVNIFVMKRLLLQCGGLSRLTHIKDKKGSKFWDDNFKWNYSQVANIKHTLVGN